MLVNKRIKSGHHNEDFTVRSSVMSGSEQAWRFCVGLFEQAPEAWHDRIPGHFAVRDDRC